MKNQLYLTLCVLLLVVLTACQGNTPLTFSGEGKKWAADVIVESFNNQREQKEIKLRYKGKDVSFVGELQFLLDAPNGNWSMGVITLDQDGKFTKKEKVGADRATDRSDTIILTVIWKGQTETFPLKIK